MSNIEPPVWTEKHDKIVEKYETENPWYQLEQEKKDVTNEELKGKLLYINNSIITLLKMRGL